MEQTPGRADAGSPVLNARWELLRNGLEHGGGRARLTITSDRAIEGQQWAIYFNQHQGIRTESVRGSVRIDDLGGDFYGLAPNPGFAGFGPDRPLVVEYDTTFGIVQRDGAPEGMYWTTLSDDGVGIEYGGVAAIAVAPFTRPEQLHRDPSDRVPLATASHRYDRNKLLERLPDDAFGPLIPAPLAIEPRKGAFTIAAGTRVSYEPELAEEARYLAERLGAHVTFAMTTEPANTRPAEGDAKVPAIHLRKRALRIGSKRYKAGDEAYSVRVDPAGITIDGVDAAGVLYGVQTLVGLIAPEALRERRPQLSLPATLVRDAPRFSYRGLHVDVSRNFLTKQELLRVIDMMAVYKLNKLHLHLTDDEGWRFEVPELPELTEVGARRGHTLDEAEWLHPSYGSGRDPASADNRGTGYYDRAALVEILQHARRRHIEVVPEIDVPGHARAAIVAMKARASRLRAQGQAEAAAAFGLHDPDDRSQYRSAQNYRDNVVSICQESTYRFLETVVGSLAAAYEQAQAPFVTMHIGGDEVPHGAWERSPVCQRFLAEHPELDGLEGLNRYFLQRWSQILARHGLELGAWEELATRRTPNGGHIPRPELSGGALTAYVWNNRDDNVDLGNRLANAGYPVVLCSATNLYLDLAYEKDPLEPGLIWAGFVDARDPFSFVPQDVFKSKATDLMGHPIDIAGLGANRQRLTAKGLRRVLGIQAQLWSERIRGIDQLEYMAFPRLLAVAERAWAAAPAWADLPDPLHAPQFAHAWNEFANRVGQREMPRLDVLFGGVAYRLPPPGAVILDGMLHANVEFPGLTIRYTLDGSEPTAASAEYREPVPVTGPVKLKSFDTRGRGSRTTIVEPPPR